MTAQFVISGTEIDLKVSVVEKKVDGIAFQVWPAALILSQYLAQSPDVVKGKTVLELGAGCGVCGMIAGMCGAVSVILTDCAETVSHLQENIAANVLSLPEGVVEATSLEWGESSELSADIVIVSDCLYWAHLHQRLLHTLRVCCDATATVVILAHHWRRVEAELPFFSGLETYFSIKMIWVQTAAADGEMLSHSEDWEHYIVSQAEADQVVLLQCSLREGHKSPSSPNNDHIEEDPEALLARIRLIEQDIASIEATEGG